MRRAFDVAIAEHGQAMQPLGADGPTVIAVDYEHVRTEFYRSQPADGDDERQRMAAKRSAFNRAVSNARERGLLVTRDLGATTVAWRPDA